MNELTLTSDGSHTIFVTELNEHYHSVHGAVQESALVYIKNGLHFCNDNPLCILEIGFGTGLNALLSAKTDIHEKRKIFYTSVEKYPLPAGITDKLNYPDFAGDSGGTVFNKIHNAKWGTFEQITDVFSLRKIECDLVNDTIAGEYGLIYFDAFGPDKQPEMWTPEIFDKIGSLCSPGALFLTYSAKGEVKRQLKRTGFRIEMLPGPPGKREMIRAVKL
jgi:tRNA U34 5-methylaminomethyl-2-thiouridine-forming methyltransferase MnmC